MKLLRLVRVRLSRTSNDNEWMNPYYFCVSSKEENPIANFERNSNVSDNSGKWF